jgi:hypothetical protein
MSFDLRMRICVSLVAGLAACSPTEEQGLPSAENALVSEAMALQQCEITKGYSSDQCASQRKTYERDLAAFKSTYAK